MVRFAHYFRGFRQGVQLSPLGFAACQSKNCTNRTSGEEAPTEYTEYTEPLTEKSLPQMTRMFTDIGGYGIPAIPTLTNSVYSVNSVGEKIFPQNARNAQKLLAEKSLPQMAQMSTD